MTKSGMLSRANVGGLGTFDILISYMTTQCAMGIVQAVLWTLVAVFGFGLDITGPLWVYILICILTTTCATSFGKQIYILI
ncbi:unnamed protein product [Orchesella dallaii]|uniref:ABC-2 type transporter transmembrane domain-containing protein n=1 Tax=Orchesella dallaii TaxID=48710 RepID=A0ABP1PID8_9HEXA